MSRDLLRSRALVMLALTAVARVAHAQAAAMPVATEFDKLHFRSIGPATMSGRVADLAVYEANPAIYYVGTAHGGVWKTTSNGATFTALFQDQGLIAIGDVTVSQSNPDLLWVGTGESNNRQSGSWGSGLYKSTDGGKTFAFMGLPNSKHINRIIIHPSNNDIVLVAATGPLYGPGGDRGVYKTTDGGKSWKLVLKGDDDTGANDLAVSLSDPNIMYASTYQRRRTTCCMNGGGPGSALWKSTDAGETWTRLAGNGFPAGPLGRIAVDIFRQNAQVVYATIEGPGGGFGGGGGGGEGGEGAAPNAPPRPGQPPAATVTGTYRSNDGGQSWTRVSAANPRPMYFSQVRIDPTNPDRVYLGGVGLHMSETGGKTFETDAALVTHDDIHGIWINPRNSDHILIGNDGGLAVSYDKSQTWTFIPNLPVGLFYHVGFDMEQPYNICGGMQDNYNWCGPSASRMNRGIMNHDWFQILGGDGFVAIPDLRDSRIVYTESQDGNIIRRNKITGESRTIRPTPQNVVNATKGEAYRFHWDTPMILSPNDAGALIVAANRVFRSTDKGDSWEAISPDLTKGANRDSITTMGLKGSDIRISRNDGISQWPAIVALAESPKQAGVYYTGTDDGTVSVSRDNGKTWQDITKNLPGFPSGYVFVSEVVPSRFEAGTVYVTVENHRENDFAPYIWVSKDFGATFTSLVGNLKGEVVRTLTEDTKNPNVLYIGTETGIFLTLDKGVSWRRLKANFPDVRVDELTIHPRDNALLVATHGRALFVLDHLGPIQEYAAAAQVSTAKLFTPGPSLQWKSKDDRNDEFWGHQFFTGENPPTETLLFVNMPGPLTNPLLRFTDEKGTMVREVPFPAAKNAAGIQTLCWDQRVEPIRPLPNAGGGGGGGGGGQQTGAARPVPGIPQQLPPIGYLAENPCAPPTPPGGGGGGGGFGGGGANNLGPMVSPGRYTVSLVADGKVVDSKPLTLIMDPAVQMDAGARTRYNAVLADLHEAQRKGTEAARPLAALFTEVNKVAPQVDSSAAPAEVKTEWANFRKEFDALRAKFGVPPAAGGFGGGGGGGAAAAAAAAANTLGRVAAVKGAIMGIWEPASPASIRQANEAKAALSAAIAEANAFLPKARAMSQKLAGFNVTMAPPQD